MLDKNQFPLLKKWLFWLRCINIRWKEVKLMLKLIVFPWFYINFFWKVKLRWRVYTTILYIFIKYSYFSLKLMLRRWFAQKGRKIVKLTCILKRFFQESIIHLPGNKLQPNNATFDRSQRFIDIKFFLILQYFCLNIFFDVLLNKNIGNFGIMIKKS